MVCQANTNQIHVQDKHKSAQVGVSCKIRMLQLHKFLVDMQIDSVYGLQGHACRMGRQQRIHFDSRHSRKQEVSAHCHSLLDASLTH